MHMQTFIPTNHVSGMNGPNNTYSSPTKPIRPSSVASFVVPACLVAVSANLEVVGSITRRRR